MNAAQGGRFAEMADVCGVCGCTGWGSDRARARDVCECGKAALVYPLVELASFWGVFENFEVDFGGSPFLTPIRSENDQNRSEKR